MIQVRFFEGDKTTSFEYPSFPNLQVGQIIYLQEEDHTHGRSKVNIENPFKGRYQIETIDYVFRKTLSYVSEENRSKEESFDFKFYDHTTVEIHIKKV